MTQPSRLERRMKLIEDKIDARIAAIEKAFETERGPFNSHKLSEREKIEYFASQPEEKQWQLWQEMDEAERQEIQAGLAQLRGIGPETR